MLLKMVEIAKSQPPKEYEHPLFMTEEEIQQDLKSNANPDLEALTRIDYDGTPEEAAESERVTQQVFWFWSGRTPDL